MIINCAILCGGSGTRLWPLSRKKLPKQFLKLTNDKTMLQNTINRLNSSSCVNINKFIIICNKEHYFLVESQIEELKIKQDYIIVTEPIGRDTAPAVAISALLSYENNVTIVLPCDHVFKDDDFCETIAEGLKYVNNSIVTFGVKPTYPETGYGYIEIDNDTFKTISFKEKPDSAVALEYYKSGKYLWNAGIFMFENKTMIECFDKYAHDILQNCRKTLNSSKQENKLLHLNASIFEHTRIISVDYAIMENLTFDKEASKGAFTVPYNSKWSDIGSFKALYDECEKDEQQNVAHGSIMYNSSNCYVNGEREIACIGVKNLIVVDTRDALLICDKESSQDIKHVTKLVSNSELLDVHAKAFRPWGWYINIEGDSYSGFKVKRIGVYPGKRLSLQSHNKRSEHWVIVRGNAKVELGNTIHMLKENNHIYIPVKELHRIENIGDDMLEFVETQIGSYLGEDDIVRYEDDFGRI